GGIRDRNVTGVQTCALPILNTLKNIRVGEYEFVIAIANNEIRKQIAEEYLLDYVNIIHPKSTISRLAKVGVGNIILPNTTVDPDTVINNHVIINKNNSLG